jgi:uncharacterized protein
MLPHPGHHRTPAAAPLRLLVLQATPFCNIDCSYCYLSERSSKARMTLETLDLACRRVFESPFLGPSLDVAWHGGEPLAAPLAWYREAVALMAARCPAGLHLRHCFQTNGLLLNEAWADFFAAIGARVGISIDGPADLHDACRRTRRGQGTHAGALRAVRLMRDRGADFHVITVLTERSLEEPDRLFEFYMQNGIANVGFNVEEVEGANRASSLAGADVEERFRRFMRRFFDLVWRSNGRVRVREFEDAVGLIASGGAVSDPQNQAFAILSVRHDGAVSTFSPELSGSRHARFPTFAFGNVATHGLADLARSPLLAAVDREIQDGVEACRRDCAYFGWCGGGAPANKIAETGRFDTTRTMHCRLTRQIMLDEVVAGLDSRLHRGRDRATATIETSIAE